MFLDSLLFFQKRELLSEVAKGKLPFLTPADATFESLVRSFFNLLLVSHRFYLHGLTISLKQ